MVVSAKNPRSRVSLSSAVFDRTASSPPVGGEKIVVGFDQCVAIVNSPGLPLHGGVVLGGDPQFLGVEIVFGRLEDLMQRGTPLSMKLAATIRLSF